MRELFKRRIEQIIRVSLFEQNDETNRGKVITSLNDAMNFNFRDKTTPELVQDGYVLFEGLDPETNKVITLTIAPTYYQFDIDGIEKRRY